MLRYAIKTKTFEVNQGEAMNFQALSTLAGRVLIGVIYVLSGVSKITDYTGTGQYMASEHMPMIPVLLPAAIMVEIAGGLAVIAGYKARIAAFVLAGYSILATTIFNHFWSMPPGPMQATVMHLFWSTIVMVGACLFIAGMGPGPLSLEGAALRKPATA